MEEAEWEMEEVEAAYEWVEKKLVYRPPMKGWQSALKDGLLEAGVLPYNGFTLDHIYGTKIGVMLFDREGQKHSVVELLKYANSDTIVVYLYAYVHKILFTTKGNGCHTHIFLFISIFLDMKTMCFVQEDRSQRRLE